jgi:hypothetical protein
MVEDVKKAVEKEAVGAEGRGWQIRVLLEF